MLKNAFARIGESIVTANRDFDAYFTKLVVMLHRKRMRRLTINIDKLQVNKLFVYHVDIILHYLQ